MSDYLHRVGTATFDSSGAALVELGPDAPNQYWTPKLIHVAVSLSANTGFSANYNFVLAPPTAHVYHNQAGITTPGVLIDATSNGFGDTSGLISGTVVQFGETIAAQWLNGYPGDIAVLNVYGESSNLPPSQGIAIPEVLGTGFVNPIPLELPWVRARNSQVFAFNNPGLNNTVTIIPATAPFTLYLHSMYWEWPTANTAAFGVFQDTFGQQILFDNPANTNPRFMDFKGIDLSFEAGFQWKQTGALAANTISCGGGVVFSAATQPI